MKIIITNVVDNVTQQYAIEGDPEEVAFILDVMGYAVDDQQYVQEESPTLH